MKGDDKLPRDKTFSHIKIMEAARAEFLEKGFEKASMRSIAKRCDMTAAGIYRHCKDKEDLFYQIVTPAKEKIESWAREHMARYEEPVKQGKKISWQDSHFDMMRELIYPNMEDYHLLVAKSKGSMYENYLHDLSEESQSKLINFFEELKTAGYEVPNLKPFELHLLMSAYTTALFEPVIHNYSYDDAIRALDTLERFFLPGWKQLIGL